MMDIIHRFVADQSGATTIEYGLIASLVGLTITTAVLRVGVSLTTNVGQVSGNLP